MISPAVWPFGTKPAQRARGVLRQGGPSVARNAVLETPPLSGGHEVLATGVAIFRIGSLAWMIVFNVVSGQWDRAWLAWLSFAIATAWTAWIFFHRIEQDRRWVLWFDLALSTYLVLISAFVVHQHAVISADRLFFATAYPVSTPLIWGMARDVRGGLFSAAVLSVALALTRPLNGVHYSHLSQLIGVVNGSSYFFMAGGTFGAIRRSLDRSARSVEAAAERETQERDLAAKEQTRAARLAVRLDLRDEIHSGVLQDLGLLRRRLRDLIDTRPEDDALRSLDRAMNHALEGLRDVITRQKPDLPTGMASLEDWLIDTKRRVSEIEVTLALAAKAQLPTVQARELCAAVEQALRNIEQHADANTAWIFADVEDNLLCVRVIDRGRGFNHDTDRPAATGHSGIEGMRRRIDSIGGKMGIVTATGMGTTVEFRLPLGPGWSMS
jgi:signal transduction histidine kinase